jgi:hypothetical protein
MSDLPNVYHRITAKIAIIDGNRETFAGAAALPDESAGSNSPNPAEPHN